MNSICSIHWVKEQSASIRFVDCRFHLQHPQKGKQEYEHSHIPGAIYMDLEKDLSSPIQDTGGRHPLPSLIDFQTVIQNAGLKQNDIIVAYDDQNHAMASRFIWMMKYMGHKHSYVLNGGWNAWLETGMEVSREVPNYPVSSFERNVQRDMIADQEYVTKHMHEPNTIILDSRSYTRYAGIEEPIDKKAGHIPSALNSEWTSIMKPNGKWKSKDELIAHFSQFGDPEKWIVYCGSGVTAVPNVLALYEAGFQDVHLYVGSWSDWITNSNNPIEAC